MCEMSGRLPAWARACVRIASVASVWIGIIGRIVTPEFSGSTWASELPRGPEYVGSQSCSASHCHGGSRAVADPGFAAWLVWEQHDPHSRSFDSLKLPKSADIIRRLGRGWKAADEEQRCLSCHDPVRISNASPGLEEYREGVSCEACHGAAEKWLRPHARRDWRSLSIGAKKILGFANTKEFFERGLICAGCHIGSLNRDVNHEMYAAGHPLLRFELSATLANYVKHWDLTKDHARSRGIDALQQERPSTSVLDAHLWRVGEYVSAVAALQLTRARLANSEATWPEFSEYSCFSCHHDLKAQSWRKLTSEAHQAAGDTPGWLRDPPGALPWNPKLRLSLHTTILSDTTPPPSFFRLLQHFRSGSTARHEMLIELDQFLESCWPNPTGVQPPMTRKDLLAIAQQLTDPDVPMEYHWEYAASAYLGLAAVIYSLPATDEPQFHRNSAAFRLLEHERDSLRHALSFTAETTSPRMRGAADLKAIRDALANIRWDLLGEKKGNQH